jgi:hypothetical protein
MVHDVPGPHAWCGPAWYPLAPRGAGLVNDAVCKQLSVRWGAMVSTSSDRPQPVPHRKVIHAGYGRAGTPVIEEPPRQRYRRVIVTTCQVHGTARFTTCW